jgi:hypothetical protein
MTERVHIDEQASQRQLTIIDAINDEHLFKPWFRDRESWQAWSTQPLPNVPAVLAEQMESRLVNIAEIDVSQHSLLSSMITRLAHRIGIARVPKNVTHSLAAYLEGKLHEEAESG